jgi:hypothetical protein
MLPKIVEAFSDHGWQTKHLLNGDLSLKKEKIKLHWGNVQFDESVKWAHNGEKGSLLFPLSWLSRHVVEFYGMEIHVVAPELQYVLKENPALLNPNWLMREKDILDRENLRDILLQKGTEICSLHTLVTSI